MALQMVRWGISFVVDISQQRPILQKQILDECLAPVSGENDIANKTVVAADLVILVL